MKKFLLILLIMLSLFMISGCGKKNTEEKKEEEVKEVLADDEVVLENIKYKLDQDDSSYKIDYKIASNFRKTVLTNAVNYFSENIDDQAYFVIRIFYYKNKSIDYAIKDTTESYDKKYEIEIGDKKYTVVHFVNFTGADVELYYYKHKKDVYAYCFTSHIDLTRLRDIFLKSVVYK